MVKVSVILPVYGVAQFIEKCTRSLLAQTLEDMEFIFVDDHGPDNSIELVQNLITNHPRKKQFVFLRPEHNMGAGMARNYALPYAKGEYIAFVDSDDWVEPNMFEELYNEAVRHGGADLCFCQISKDYTDGHPSDIVKNPDIATGKLSEQTKKYFLTHYVSLFSTYIYKNEMIRRNEIHFPESRSADDSFFITSSLLFAETMARVDKPFYHYILRPGSVTTTKDSTKYQKRLATFNSLLAYLKEKGVYEKYKDEVDFIYLKKGYFSSVFNYVSNSSEPKKNTVREIHDELVSKIPDYRNNPYYRKKCSLRLLQFLIHRCTGLALKLIPVYVRRTNQVV